MFQRLNLLASKFIVSEIICLFLTFLDKDFLVFFYSRLRKNEFQRYTDEFPFVSLCGRERNFVRCDDTPIVFTQILKKNGDERLSYNNGGERLTVLFEPERIFMNPESGRVYYPTDEKFDGFGLVKSTINEELSPFFVYDNGDSAPPTKLKWNKVERKLTNELFEILKNRPDKKIFRKSA